MIRLLMSLTQARGRALLRSTLVWAIVTAVLQGLAFLALVPWLRALLSGAGSASGVWSAVLAGLGLAYGLAFWRGNQSGNAAAIEVLSDLLKRLGDRLVELPTGWFAADRAGETADVASRGIVFASAAPYAILCRILTAFITPATVLLGTWLIDWRVAAAMTASVPVIWSVYRWLARRLAAADQEHVAAIAEASNRVIEFARVQPALRAAGDNSIATELVDQALRGQHAAAKRMHLTGGAGLALFGGVVQLAVIAVLVVGSGLALAGRLDIATLLPLLVLAVRFTEPICHSGALGGGLSVATNTLKHIRGLIDHPSLPEPAVGVPFRGRGPAGQSAEGAVGDDSVDEPAADPALRLVERARPGSDSATQPEDHTVRFDRVTFGYGGAPVLRDLSFEAPVSAMTAIVGPSGSGKTTITRLIARFYDPESGQVSIGRRPLPELGSDWIVQAVAPVFQDVYLFDGSILDNIWLGRPEASQEEARRAGRQARVDEIVERLPAGWDSRVGEGGTNLSGGERQRVSIARALLKDAPIVLLDEATAALDSANEQAIQEAFTALRPGRTLIVVAHRLSTIATADRIIMLNQSGGIAEQGAHEELLAAGGDYARYWSERVQAAGWRLASHPQ
ncbi:MAG: ABC transporter ATP-binding protein/permease [Propionibacteriaceae bacterium]|jgi:ATP-binding cassette subfamily B protein|nr:ABC transporter ATP-binding protein/permease [Propionibacteriaceae bacterium]